jgi:hypothetical protein
MSFISLIKSFYHELAGLSPSDTLQQRALTDKTATTLIKKVAL